MTSNTPQSLIDRAKEIGIYAAKLEIGLPAGTVDDTLHHMGDDTGRVITDAYRLAGAELAAKIIDTYLDSLNETRVNAGGVALDPHQAIRHLQWATNALTQPEQEEVRTAFAARHP